MSKKPAEQPKELATSRWQRYLQASHTRLRELSMRTGGEPFAPFEIALDTLTEEIVRKFNVRSFWGFAFLERLRRDRRGNKYTRFGAAPFRGDYVAINQPQDPPSKTSK